jgi:elongation factor P
LTINIDGNAYSVLELQHVKPGKGAAFVRTKLKNLKTGMLIEKTFRSEDKIEEAFIQEKKLQFLYSASDMCYFLDQENFEEVIIPKENISKQVKFIKDNLELSAYFYENELLNINLPTFITLKVVHTESGLKGDTAKSAMKSAQLETGLVIQVPLFINVGDVIKVDTRTSNYVERVS